VKRPWLLIVVMVILGGCGGGGEPDGTTGEPGGGTAAPTTDGGGTGSTGNVVNRQPPGQGAASVDGQEFTFNTPGGLACKVTGEDFAFSFIIGDNEIAMGGGASISGGQWFGNLSLQIYADDGVTEYSAKLIDNPSGIAIDGNSVSYSGPMEKFTPAPPGELPEAVDVGEGVFTATCG
jgi:hypothetical protein